VATFANGLPVVGALKGETIGSRFNPAEHSGNCRVCRVGKSNQERARSGRERTAQYHCPGAHAKQQSAQRGAREHDRRPAETRFERLVLSPSVQIARIEIQLDSRDDYPRFRAELRRRSGEEVLSRGNLVRRKSGPGFAVSVDVPASALAVGDYELALKGIAADHTSQDLGSYYFGVQRR
jgi:hypothetical protein